MDAERLGCCFAKRIPNLNSKPDRATIQGFRRHKECVEKECVELSKYCQNKVLNFFCSSLQNLYKQNFLKLGEDSVSVLLGAGLTTEVSGNSLALSDSLRYLYQHFERVEEPGSSTYGKSGLLDLVGELVKTHVSVDKQVSHVTSQRMCMIRHARIQGRDNDGRDLCHLPEHHQ